MTTIYLGANHGLGVVRFKNDRWRAAIELVGLQVQCLAADPHRPERVYCGTFGRGLWRSDDAGASWAPVADGIPYADVMSVAVSPLERHGRQGVVWAGTEPSALFRSEDGGDTWRERPALRELPSAPTWSFPPRPWTHHVRWITPDPCVAERIFVGIELGGVMRSRDAGLTWEDRKRGSQLDAHTLSAHRLAPGRIYEAAGGGYAESRDGGESWRGFDEGLRHHYLWGLAVDPADPETILIAAARGPREAHSDAFAEATIYRRTSGPAWQEVRMGLPRPKGTRIYVLAANDAEPGVFFAATAGNLYRSADAGVTWERLDVTWPDGYRTKVVHAMVVVHTS